MLDRHELRPGEQLHRPGSVYAVNEFTHRRDLLALENAQVLPSRLGDIPQIRIGRIVDRRFAKTQFGIRVEVAIGWTTDDEERPGRVGRTRRSRGPGSPRRRCLCWCGRCRARLPMSSVSDWWQGSALRCTERNPRAPLGRGSGHPEGTPRTPQRPSRKPRLMPARLWAGVARGGG